MLGGSNGAGKVNTLMGEYSVRLGEALLRVRTREAEQTARLEGEIAKRVKSEFISNMSHELRTPLNTVIGFSKLLAEHERRQLKSADITEYGRLIQDSAAHLLSLINDILDISKLQSGRYFLDSQEIEIEDIIPAALATQSKAAAAAGVTLMHEIAPDLPVLLGDGTKLMQALANIISNAVKFTKSGGHVAVVAEPADDGSIEIAVRDTGIGMDEDELQVAIAPFGQVDGGRTRWREGAGLGLPIAKALIELHGGTIQIASAKGIGTEVVVRLPSQDQLESYQRQEDAVQLSSR